jgi:hypothetical protein
VSGNAPEHCAPARNLLIAIPAYQGVVATETAASLIEVVPLLKQAGMKVQTHFLNGSCYIDSARNDLVAEFLESGFSDMLFIDADVGFLAGTIIRLCMATRPFVAAIYPKKEQDEKISFPVEFLVGERWTDKEGLVEVKMVPTGCLRLNRAVFDHVQAPEYTNSRGRKQRAYFRTEFREFHFGEDVEFCRFWREAGGKVWIYPDALMAHFGFKSWRANCGEVMKSNKV